MPGWGVTSSTGTRPELVLRSPWLLWAWCAALLAGGVAALVAATGEARDEPVALVLGLAAALVALWALARIPLMSVALGPDGVRNHGLWRTWGAAWHDVERVEVEPVHDEVVATSWAPVLHLRGGRRRALVQLAGYTTAAGAPASRMARQAQLLRDRLAA